MYRKLVGFLSAKKEENDKISLEQLDKNKITFEISNGNTKLPADQIKEMNQFNIDKNISKYKSMVDTYMNDCVNQMRISLYDYILPEIINLIIESYDSVPVECTYMEHTYSIIGHTICEYGYIYDIVKYGLWI